MSTIKSFIKRHPLPTYFALAFTISWGGLLLLIGGPGAIPSPNEQAMLLVPVAILVMVVGPSVAGFLLTGFVCGRAGYREFLSHLFQWRVGAHWHAIALLTAPLLAIATLFALLPTSPVFLPGIVESDDKISRLLIGIAAGLLVGIFEEIGWTGFAVPRLRQHYSIFSTGLIVGFLWGVWHYILAFWGSGDPTGAFSPGLFLPPMLFYVGVLPVYRVLMVWVYDRTGSLPVVMLMHACLSASVPLIFTPLEISGVPLMIWYFVLTATLWVLIVAVVQARQTLPRQV